MAEPSRVKGVSVYSNERMWRESARKRGNPTTKPGRESSKKRKGK